MARRSKTSKTLEAVKRARARRDRAERDFQDALAAAREVGEHSWAEIGEAAGLERTTVRYYVMDLNERRQRDAAVAES